MSWDSVDPQAKEIGEPVQKLLAEKYRKKIKVNEAIDASLGWRPTLHVEKDALIIAAETMSTPFPEILQLTKLNILNAHLPITVYSVCKEAAYLTAEGQKQARALRANGLGLFTVDETGLVTEQFSAIPLIQHIPEAEIEEQLVGLPAWLKQSIRDAFANYRVKATSGITDISEVLEGMVNNAVKAAIKKKWLSNKCKNYMLAESLDALAALAELKDCRAAIGGARAFVKDFRNTANHAARTRRQVFNKFRKSKIGFFAAIQAIESFYTSMKAQGINVR